MLEWGKLGEGDGEFTNPIGIAVDARGNVYVGEAGNPRIQKFDSNGRFLSKFGSRGTGNGRFASIDDLAIDAQGNLYVSDSGGDNIQKFRLR